MKSAISIIGRPLAGKTTIVGAYQDRALQVGKYVRGLKEENPIKQECVKYWKRGSNFPSQLLSEILKEMTFPDANWVLIDNSPTGIDTIQVIEDYFDLKAIVELEVPDDVWEKRLKNVLSNGRNGRVDNIEQALRTRKEYFDSQKQIMRERFINYYVINNSKDIMGTFQEFERLIKQVFP